MWLAAMLLAGTVPAQQLRELPRRLHYPESPLATLSFAVADVDGDGFVDIALGRDGQRSAPCGRLYRGMGRALFADATARWPTADETRNAMVFGDVDGDGDQDLVTADAAQNHAYRNDGGALVDVTATALPGLGDRSHCLALFDADGDGDLDLFVGNDGQSRLLRNDGAFRFVEVTSVSLPARTDVTWAVAAVDVDRDGDVDLVLANAGLGQQNRLYRNDGRGVFADATATSLPVDSDRSQGVVAGDFDGDGDQDLVFANDGTRDRYYVNDGAGVFADGTATHLPPLVHTPAAVAAADLDGDHDLDLVFAGWDPDRVYRNDGAGVFVAVAGRLPPVTAAARTVVLADVDADGDPDLLVGNDDDVVRASFDGLFLNDGTGTFTDAVAPRLPARDALTTAVAAGDVDGDGHVDLLVSSYLDAGFAYRNDGSGSFDRVRGLGFSWDSSALELVDLDGDGDLDLIDCGIAGWRNDGVNRIYLNDGRGGLQAAVTPAVVDRTAGAAAGDVDGDGDLDVVFANDLEQNRLLRNDGAGVFSELTTWLPPDADATLAAAFGDLDGDGDVDLVFANAGQNKLYDNVGSGFVDVTATRLPVDAERSGGLALADFDGDGDLDLVFANDGASGAQNRLYLNDGRGHFVDATAGHCPARLDHSVDVQAVDLDGDGDQDLLFAGYGTALAPDPCRLWLNDGHGSFADATAARVVAPAMVARHLVVGDFDRDGDVDVVLQGADQLRLLVNLHRQFAVPVLPMLGEPYTLAFVARPGYGTDPTLVVPALAAAAAPVPIALGVWGTFFLDPPATVLLPALVLADTATLDLPVPTAPQLVGAPLWSQALFLDWQGGGHLTGRHLDRVLN